MIEDGDGVLIGLSGGMDSLVMTDLLAERVKIFRPRFRVAALHVSMEGMGYESDAGYLRDFCESRGVEFRHKITRLPEGEKDSKQKSPCFLCSWQRRKLLFETASELGFNKIALGHHQDDVIKTMLMNIVFQGAFAAMPAVLRLEKMPLAIIRPMCTLKEEDIKLYARLSGYQKQQKLCPHERESHRDKMNLIFNLMQEMNPEARHSLWAALENVQETYLPRKI